MQLCFSFFNSNFVFSVIIILLWIPQFLNFIYFLYQSFYQRKTILNAMHMQRNNTVPNFVSFLCSGMSDDAVETMKKVEAKAQELQPE